MSAPGPPPWIRGLVNRLLPGPYGTDVVEELDEEFRTRAEGGALARLRATLWYLAQVVRPDTLRLALRLRRRSWKQMTAERSEMAGRNRGLAAFLGRLGDDVHSAARSLARNPSYALLAAFTLALGIGATTATFSAVDSVLLHPFPYEATQRMYGFNRPVGRLLYPPTSQQIEAWSAQRDLLEGVLRLGVERKTLTGAGPAKAVRVGRTDESGLDLLDIRPLLGRSFLPADSQGEGRRVVILAHDVWRTRFGRDPDVVGRAVSLQGEPWEVIGVMPPRAPFPDPHDANVEFWAPLPDADIERSSVIAIAREGVTAADIQARIDLIRERAVERGEPGDRWEGSVYSVADRLGGLAAEPLRILMAAVVLVLLIAFVNMANLLLGRAALRRTETAVRGAIGASRARLVRQLLIEAVLLGAVGAALGIVVAWGSMEALHALRPENLAVLDGTRIDGQVLGFAAAIGLLGAGFFGTIPAWQATGTVSLSSLKSGTWLGRRSVVGRRSRWLLVCGEVALSFALLVGSVTAVRALVGLQRRDLGFDADRLVFVVATLPSWEYDDEALLAETRRFRNLIESQEGVVEVSHAEQPPIVAGFIRSATPQVEGAEPREEPDLLLTNAVDADFHRVAGIPILAGRGFTDAEARDSASVVILGRETAVTLFGNANAVGQRFRYGPAGDWYTVVGVAGDIDPNIPDFVARGLQVYHPMRRPMESFPNVIRVADGYDPRRILDGITRALRAEAPDVLLPVATTGQQLMASRIARERFTGALLATFALLAAILAIVGLYGVVSSLVGQRTREIGIRISLGANRGDVRWLVLSEGAKATALGIAVGTGVAWAGLRILSSRIFGLGSADAARSYAVTAVLLSLATVVACWVPARRAVNVDPVEAIREE